MPSEMSDVWIVVPAFNEAGVIGDVITDLRSIFANVVCVDDGSADDTGDIARPATRKWHRASKREAPTRCGWRAWSGSAPPR